MVYCDTRKLRSWQFFNVFESCCFPFQLPMMVDSDNSLIIWLLQTARTAKVCVCTSLGVCSPSVSRCFTTSCLPADQPKTWRQRKLNSQNTPVSYVISTYCTVLAGLPCGLAGTLKPSQNSTETILPCWRRVTKTATETETDLVVVVTVFWIQQSERKPCLFDVNNSIYPLKDSSNN